MALNARGKHPTFGKEVDGSTRNERGLLLLTTAIAHEISKFGATANEIQVRVNQLRNGDIKTAFTIALLEQDCLQYIPAGKSLIAGGNLDPTMVEIAARAANMPVVQGSEYLAQQAAMDPVVNSFFWLWRMCRANGDTINMRHLAIGLEAIAEEGFGSSKIAALLTSSVMPHLRTLASLMVRPRGMNAKLCPPWVATPARIYDFKMCFGANVPANPLDMTRGNSPRSLCNISAANSGSFALIANIFNAEILTDPDWNQNGHILSSEHMLHQILLGKTSPFQWAGQRTGNALRVRVV